jgi:hypothetical protein
MAVHVGEISIDVTPSPSTPPGRDKPDQPRAPGAAEQTWSELARRSAFLAARLRAEGFDD